MASWRRRRPGADRPDEELVVAMWTRAEEALDGGATHQAQHGFAVACDAVVAMASDPGGPPIAFSTAADFAAARGGAPPEVTPGSPEEARSAAEAAVVIMPVSAAHGLRLGLEAHVAFELLSHAQVAQMRYLLWEFGPPWARCLLACARALDERLGHRRLALHFARWTANVAGHLVPYRDDADVDALVRESLVNAARMEAAVGDPATAREIEQILHRPG